MLWQNNKLFNVERSQVEQTKERSKVKSQKSKVKKKKKNQHHLVLKFY